jgi:DNA-binding GntR family transcriptional regulator
VHAALRRLTDACTGDDPPWSTINDAHAALHTAIVDAADSPRIAAAHAALSGEMRLTGREGDRPGG